MAGGRPKQSIVVVAVRGLVKMHFGVQARYDPRDSLLQHWDVVLFIFGDRRAKSSRFAGSSDILCRSLGDIIISDSLVEYDFGRQYADGFRRKDDPKNTLGRPPREIRTVLSTLQTTDIYNQFQRRVHHHLDTLQARDAVWEKPSASCDIPYETLSQECLHKAQVDANGSDESALSDNTGPRVHIGTMASADTVMKSDKHRDDLARSERIIGFEMEGAGVWDNFLCLIIKGVCDYADGQKNKLFQNYAAAVGAAGAKAFLTYWPSKIRKVIPEADKSYLRDMVLTDPRVDKLRIKQSKGGMLRDAFCWVLEDPGISTMAQQWSTLLWIRGDAGKGKTMLMIGIIDELAKAMPISPKSDDMPLISYYFFQGSDSRLNTATSALRGLLYLLGVQQPALLRHVRSKYESMGRQLFEGPDAVYSLIQVLLTVLGDSSIPEIYFVIDAVDLERFLPGTWRLMIALESLTQESVLEFRVSWLSPAANRFPQQPPPWA